MKCTIYRFIPSYMWMTKKIQPKKIEHYKRVSHHAVKIEWRKNQIVQKPYAVWMCFGCLYLSTNVVWCHREMLVLILFFFFQTSSIRYILINIYRAQLYVWEMWRKYELNENLKRFSLSIAFLLSIYNGFAIYPFQFI